MNRLEKYSELLAAGSRKTLEDKLSDAHSKIHILAKDELRVVEVDHGLFEEKQGSRKCDFMVIGTRSANTHMIELKGRHIEEAFEQIADTLDTLLNDEELKSSVVSRNTLDAYIVSPGRMAVPKGIANKEKMLAKKLARGSKERPRDILELIHFVKVVNSQKAVSVNGRQIVISGRAPLELS